MPLPQKYARTISVGLTLGGVVLLTTVLRSQQTPPVGPVWEYATVSSYYANGAKTSICYAATNGCKKEQSSDRGSENAMSTAAKLGENGWELTAVTNDSGQQQERVLYFRRLRSVINRGDSSSSR